jgi:membrane-associated phospholipid phosphatase
MTAEKIMLAFMSYAVLASFAFDLSMQERALIAGLNVIAGGVLVAMSRIRQPNRFVTALREWLPTVLILVAYRESGLFLKLGATHRLDNIFILWDRIILQAESVQRLLSMGSPWLQNYLEFSYLLCYPLVPLGFAALYLVSRLSRVPAQQPPAGVTFEASTVDESVRMSRSAAAQSRRLAVDHFWTTVLLAVLACYVLFPFFPLTPPRVLFRDLPGPATGTFFRNLNAWVLGQYSVQACIFPSGHVAAVTAVALVVHRYLPRLGLLFAIIAASIAVATVYGRYHYAADAVAGALVGVAAYLSSRRLQGEQSAVNCPVPTLRWR